MSFNHIKLPELDFNLKSITTDSGRVYQTPEGNLYPSVVIDFKLKSSSGNLI